MTNEEAKEKIKSMILGEMDKLQIMYDDEVKEIVYKSTREFDELLKLNKIVSLAMDKQIPKKPMYDYSCPCCDTFLIKIKDRFCSSCGQAIDWSEEDDGDYEETSVCDSCGLGGDTWECQFCCEKCYEDYGECPNEDCDPMDL